MSCFSIQDTGSIQLSNFRRSLSMRIEQDGKVAGGKPLTYLVRFLCLFQFLDSSPDFFDTSIDFLERVPGAALALAIIVSESTHRESIARTVVISR
jgi:hypothetical protein